MTYLVGGDEAGFACVVVGPRGERMTYLVGGDEAWFACVVVGPRGERCLTSKVEMKPGSRV